MSDEQEDSHGLVGWVVGFAVAIAVTVAVLLGIMSAMDTGPGDKGQTAVAAAAPAPAPMAASAPVMPAATADAKAGGKPDAAKLYFAVNSAVAPADSATLVASLVAYAKGSANAKLSISGFHDKSGDAAMNQELAKQRAMAVKAMLIAAGVTEDRIMLQKPSETTGGGDDKEARRVEVSAVQ